MERTVLEESNEWVIIAIANYGLTYGFEELLDECFTTGSCVFLPVELMYLEAIYLCCLPCHKDHREKTKFSMRTCKSNQPLSRHRGGKVTLWPCKALLIAVANRSSLH